MGRIMKEDDLYIAGLLDLLNIRFGPSQGPGEASGGMPEMAALQREFGIFQRGRSLKSCFALLNLGGFWNMRVKNRWLALIEGLERTRSDMEDVSGNDRIMDVIIESLESGDPVPLFFKAHDSREDPGNVVTVSSEPTGLFYVQQDHRVISIPMRPRTQERAAAKPARAAGKRAATKTSRKTPGSTRTPSSRK